LLARRNQALPKEEIAVEGRTQGTLPNILEIEREGGTIIVIPLADLGELAYPQIMAGAKEVLELLDRTAAENVVMDFCKTDYCGSTALEFFVKLWVGVRKRNGRMVFCNVSDHEKEILRTTNLDHLWPICRSREEALQAVRE
jgi:anti-anti-sigma factor